MGFEKISPMDVVDVSKYRMPGQLIQEQLDKRGWTTRVLAVIVERDETLVGRIISGKRPLDANLAISLSQVFRVPADIFMELQMRYELAQALILNVEDTARANRAHIFGSLPVDTMVKRGWLNIDSIRDFSKVEQALAEFFRVSSVDEIESVFPHAAKKTNVSGSITPIQLAWFYRVKEIADEMLTAKFSKDATEQAITKLKPLLRNKESVRKVPRILQDCGIRYVICEALPGGKVDGVCFWLDEKKPVIGMSLRYDRIDNFWFVLRHEIEHVIRGHGQNQNTLMLDVETESETCNIIEEERVADDAAAEFCVPQKSLAEFMARKAPFYADRDIIGFAGMCNVHPGLVAGQLRRRLKRFDRFQTHLAKIRSVIAPSAVMDGWGNVVPVGDENKRQNT